MQHAACGSFDACCSWAFCSCIESTSDSFFLSHKFKQILLKMIEKSRYSVYICAVNPVVLCTLERSTFSI
jgi:hypothetical protein